MSVLKEMNLSSEQFRVVVFGSARIKPEDILYKEVYKIGYKVGELGSDLVTGGGPGLMDAANKGHKEATPNPENTSKSIGIRIQLPFEEEDSGNLDLKVDFKTFAKRLDAFMEISDMIIVTPGGVGTLLEMAYTWQLIQVGHLKKIPIVLVGEQWNSFYKWASKNIIDLNFANKEDLDILIPVPDFDSALTLIESYHDKYQEKLINS
ncbi:LOG family protein [bacterium]|jgi:uncharacterized protein (TIGR00730 family)|nr:LOG family protein [bacterium]MBT6294024.1 LOG family protein [bacterium]